MVFGVPAAAALAAQAQALGVGVLADDHAILRALGSPGAGLLAAFPAGIGGYFRPVTMASLALVDAFAQGSAFAQHAFGLAVHAATAGLVASIARRLAGDGVLALGLGVLYALHPAHAATVSWIAARGDLLATLGIAAALALLLRGTRLAAAGSAMAAALAIGAKESAYAIVPLLPIVGELAAGAPPEPTSSGEGAPDPRALRASARGVALVAFLGVLLHASVARVAFGGSHRALAGLGSPREALMALAGAAARVFAPGPLARGMASAASKLDPRWMALGALAVLVGS